MSLMNDVLRDLEARDAKPPVKSVRPTPSQRLRRWTMPALGGIGLLAVTGVMAMWLVERQDDRSGSLSNSNSKNSNPASQAQRPLLAGATAGVDDSAALPSTISPRSIPRPSVANAAVPAADSTNPVSSASAGTSHQAVEKAPAAEALVMKETLLDLPKTQAIDSNALQSPSASSLPPNVATQASETADAAGSRSASRPAHSPANPHATDAQTAVPARPRIVVQRTGKAQDDDTTVLDSARRALSRGQAGVAISRLEELLESQPGLFEARILLARTLLASGRPQRAESLLAEGVAQYPNGHELRFWLARIRLEQDRPEAALESLQAYSPSVEQALDFHLLRGATLHQLERHEQALDAYQEITATFPSNARAWLGQALSAEALGRTDAALAAFRQTLQHGDARTAALARQRIATLERARSAVD